MAIDRKSPGWTRRFLLALLGLCAALVLGEVLIRAGYGDRYSRRPAFYGPHDDLGWAPAPNLDHRFYGADFVTRIRTDEYGYRLGSLGEVNFGVDLLLLCGDSYTFGWGVSTGETFASHLDEAVSAHTGGRMRVVNLGVGGYGTSQYRVRLEEFRRTHPGARIGAVLVFHCMNDVTDNFATLGFTHGSWRNAPAKNERSRWHLVNFLADAGKRIQRPPPLPAPETADTARSDPPGRPPRGPLSDHPPSEHPTPPSRETPAAENKPAVEDELWRYELEIRGPLPDRIGLGADSVDISGTGIAERSAAITKKRRSLTPLQLDVYRMAIAGIHRTAVSMGCPVLHGYVYSTPDWYIDGVDGVIAGDGRGDVVCLGRIPQSGGFDGAIYNAHSGKHFTPEFNRYWAGEVFDVLRSRGIVPPTTGDGTAGEGNGKTTRRTSP